MSSLNLEPIDARGLIRAVDEELISLLRGLEPEDWIRPAVGDWLVRDVVAHLLDGALRRLSVDRDGHRPPPPQGDLSEYRELVRFLNGLNADWVTASQRLSPAVMIDLLEHVCPQMADYFDSLDPAGEAAFPVSWAAEEVSRVWMDIAREFTERWHHQQQIREAVGAPWIDREQYVRPLLETFIRAVPRSYSEVDAPEGTHVAIRIVDLAGASWSLERRQSGWLLQPGRDRAADATIEISSETSWRLFTKSITGTEARRISEVEGEAQWAEPFFATLAIMA